MEPEGHEETPETPAPTLWPVGFAIGIAVLLIGIIVSTVVAVVGGVIVAVFAFLWVRDLTVGHRKPVVVEPEVAARPLHVPEADTPDRYPRNKFLEGATLGIGAAIGAVVTLPAVGFAIVPAFRDQGHPDIDLGPIDSYPSGKFVVATYMEDAKLGEVSRRTAYVRNNGLLDGKPSFTILSNRCVHLGCPVQPNGLLFTEQTKKVKTDVGEVDLIPTLPAGFGCPCHGGQYDTEGNRTAGPPVRALDRYDFLIKNGRLYLGASYSVGSVDGEGANAKIKRFTLAGPGQHVDGPESIFYPLQPGQIDGS